MSGLRGILLDVDGTLIDSNDAHARSWEDTFREFGLDIPASRIRPLIGKGGDKLVPELTGVEVDSARGKAFTSRRSEIFKKTYLSTIQAFPRVHDLLARWRDDGLRLVVATSAQREELNALLEQAGLDELIDRTTSSSDADRSKPDPDIIDAALDRGHLAATEAIMLGDTPYDVTAATRAGIDTIALRCGGWDDDALRGAIAIYDDPSALLARYETSPFLAVRSSRDVSPRTTRTDSV
jgi:HAD superfamily hydrolase (TIGR01509 family)